MNAVAILSGDENIGKIASAFSLFVAVKYYQARKAEEAAKNAQNNQPAEDPVEQADTTSQDNYRPTSTTDTTTNSTGDSSSVQSVEEVQSSQQTTSTETSTTATTTASPSASSNVQKAKSAEKLKETKKSVISKESEKQLKELSKADPTAKKVYDEVTGPVGVNLTLVEGEITYDVRGLEITIEATQKVNLTKGTITVTFGPDGKISSITDARGNKVDFVKEGFVKLTVGLVQPTEISFGKNSAFTFTTKFSGEMNWRGRIMIYSTTIACKATGQAIKVSVGLNIDTRPPAPQKAPVGIPFAPPPVVPIPLPI